MAVSSWATCPAAAGGRKRCRQRQDVAALSRDAEHANQTLSPIFDKEKEQRRLREAQLIAEIGVQAANIAQTQGDLNGLTAAKEKFPDLNPDELRKTDICRAEMETSGTGSSLQQGIQAATAAMQGLAGGNIGLAISGAAAPYLAEQIHRLAPDEASRAMAHAVAGAVTTYVSGNSATAGAAGAVTAEVMAQLVMQQLYPGKTVSELTEKEKQGISVLGTLAAGLAGGLTGDSTAAAVTGGLTGKNAVENNLLGGNEETQTKFVQEHGKNIASCSTDPGGAACQKGLAMNDALMVALPAGLGGGLLAAATPEIAAAAKSSDTGVCG